MKNRLTEVYGDNFPIEAQLGAEELIAAKLFDDEPVVTDDGTIDGTTDAAREAFVRSWSRMSWTF